MLLLLSIIGEGECDIDLTSTAAAHIFVDLDFDGAAVEDVGATTGLDAAAATAADFLALIRLLL